MSRAKERLASSFVAAQRMRSILVVAVALASLPACSGTGQPAIATGPAKIVEIDAGGFHTCVRLDDGTAECWGQCSRQCGVRPGESAERLPIAGLANAVELAVGDAHACARLEDGDVACWGSNYSGGLGRLEEGGSVLPTRVPDVHAAVGISIDGDRTCARMADGTATCWGALPGDYDPSDAAARVRLPKPGERASDEQITHGGCECRLDTNGVVHCTGSGIMSARLADGSSPPVQLHHCPADGLANVRTLADGCAILHDGTLRCWGPQFIARAGGPPIYDDLREPIAIGGITDATALAVGASHTCVLHDGGALACWGSNAQGQIDGTPTDQGVWPPRRIGG